MLLPQFIDGIQSAAVSAAPIAVTALWQGLAIALGLTVCLRFTPRISANLRFALWAVGFALVVALPFLPQFAGPGHAGTSAGGATGAWLQVDLRWSFAIAGMWLVASFIRAGDLVVHCYQLRRLWTTAIPVTAPANMVIPRSRGRKALQICTTGELDRPSVIGFFAPRILIPEWLYERLTRGELEQIVLHEVEHLRRYDDWTNLAQKLCLVLFPLNPALWWVERQLCREREMACDEGVIAITRAPRAYAACLTSLAERGLERKAEALSLGAWQRRPELVRRVHSILRKGRSLSPLASGALLAALGGGLLAVSFEFARCPQFVAFVPARSAMLAANSMRNEGADAVDAVYRPESAHAMAAGFHAVEAKAVMQDSAATALVRPKSDMAPRKIRKPVEEAHAKITAPKSKLNQEEWLVLTSWEQVETSNANPTESPDMVPGNTDAIASSQSQNPATSRVTVTQLVFRIVPAVSKSSQSSQPKAIRFRDGWFILQL